jgi:hypothetical protein
LFPGREVLDVSDSGGDGSGDGRDDAGSDGDGRVDVPVDVEDALTQLLAEAAAAARRRDVDDVTAIVDTVETVTRNKVPAGFVRERLLYGCRRVERLADDEPLVAAEYLEAMERLVEVR